MSFRESRVSSLCWIALALAVVYVVFTSIDGFIQHAKQTIGAP